MRWHYKAVALLAAAASMISPLPALAESEGAERVEIGLRVGEQKININGEEITAEAPYIAGDGVTLVPVRVISEAFGADVGWNEAERSINISYSSVDISMRLGSTTAEINGIAQQLEYPPELTGEGVTMVPLRFISESFGAAVSYDGQTQTISVTLDGGAGDEGIIKGISESRIGDSYFGWAMDNPTGLTMSNRSDNGMYTSFYYSGVTLRVQIEFKDDNYDFDRDFVATRASFANGGYSLVSASKDTAAQRMRMTARDKDKVMRADIYAADKYIITISGWATTEDDGNAALMMNNIVQSFKTEFDGVDIYDISGLEDGVRKYELEDIALSVELPPGWAMFSEGSSLNSFIFNKTNGNKPDSTIKVEVFSKSAQNIRNASWLSAHDLSQNKKTTNPEICSFSGLVPKAYNSFTGYEYTAEVKGSVENDGFQKDVFFDKDDYVYNITFFMRQGETESEIDEILNSIKVSAPDSYKLGNLIRGVFEYDEGYYKASDDDMTVTLPYSFETDDFYTDGYIDNLTGTEMNVMGYSYIEDFDDFRKGVTEYVRKADIIKAPAIEDLDGKECFTCATRSGAYYIERYTVKTDKGYYDFAVRYPELTYSETNRGIVRSIIASAEYK